MAAAPWQRSCYGQVKYSSHHCGIMGRGMSHLARANGVLRWIGEYVFAGILFGGSCVGVPAMAGAVEPGVIAASGTRASHEVSLDVPSASRDMRLGNTHLGVAVSARPEIRVAENQGRPHETATVRLGTLDALYSVLARVKGGETILLEGGHYGDLYLGNLSNFDVAFPEIVTIASADPGDPAVFSTAQIRFVSNLTLDGLVFDYTYASGDTLRTYPFEVQKSTNVVIRNATFDGDVPTGLSEAEDGYGFSNGLFCRDTTGLTLEQSTVFQFQRGLVLVACREIRITGNDIHSMRMDGMNLVNVQDVRIEDNHIHDFNGRPGWEDHRDFIQFWTNGTQSPSTDIIIRGNVLNSGSGSFTQSIFMRNEEVDVGRAGEEMFYRNVEISGNVILNAHLHGITVGETDGLKILNNTVIRNPLSEGPGINPIVWTPRIELKPDSRNVVVLRNVTSAISGQGRQSRWEIRDNLLVQDRNPRMAFYYADVFGPAALEDPTRIESFFPRPGGPLDGTGIGAPRLTAPPSER